MKTLSTLFAAAALLCCGTVAAGNPTYRGDAPEVRYVGRTLVSDDGSVSFDWSGTYFETVFDGSSLAMTVSDTGTNYYNIFIDGQPAGKVTTSGTRQRVILAGKLKRGPKRIRVQKRTEGEQGTTTIHGFETSPRGTLSPVPDPPKRHIEFIGNSLTCGYGTEGLSPTERFSPATENCDLAYACITARYFDADYTLIAHSGQGAARNWGDEKQLSDCTMKDRMLRTFDMDPSAAWDFARSPHKPDVVVVNLGSNDFSDPAPPTYEQFSGAYLYIIERIREGYGDIPILCITPMFSATGGDYVKRLCAENSDSNLHLCDFGGGLTNWDSDLGSDYHPNHSGQRKMAMTLIPRISTLTGWELYDKTVR